VGGGIRNGLAIQIDSLAPGQVMLVTGSSLLQQYLFLNSNNTESNQTYAVIPVFEDCNDIIHRVGGQFFNTANNGIHGTWDTLRMTVQFASAGLTLSTLSPPFNPFVIKGMNRDFEIHLPDHLPTGLAKTTYFGMHDDDTRPGVGRYYKTHKNLPWGMDFPIPFNYPFENVSLDSAYLHVTQWAVSGGTKYTDWYYNSAPGYRNDSGIYH
jgi:LruC domain-containing protein